MNRHNEPERYDLLEYIAGEVGIIREKVDTIIETTVKTDDCKECRSVTAEAIASKVSQSTFDIIWRTILAVGSVFGLITGYLVMTGNLIKVFGG